jgi:hypothetical protein
MNGNSLTQDTISEMRIVPKHGRSRSENEVEKNSSKSKNSPTANRKLTPEELAAHNR